MTDEMILSLYFERNEDAIAQTKTKYHKYLYTIAHNILNNREDAEECENSTYFAAWNSIPPNRPKALSLYLGKIVRNFALKQLRKENAQKRGGGEALLSLEELGACIPDTCVFDQTSDAQSLGELLSRFLYTLDITERRVFICRYFHCDSIKSLAKTFGMKESRVKMMLMRTREKLSLYLQKEGVSR